MSKTSLSSSCYSLLQQIPKGKVTTYKSLALALNTKAYRAIGQIMKRNPYPQAVQCYKVVKSDGSIGGYLGSDIPNIKKKIQLLKKDGIEVEDNKVDLNKYLHEFNKV